MAHSRPDQKHSEQQRPRRRPGPHWRFAVAAAAAVLWIMAAPALASCPAGQYSSQPSNTCLALTVCFFDEFESAAPTNTTDRVCSPHPQAVRADLLDDMRAFANDGQQIGDLTRTGSWSVQAEGADLAFSAAGDSFGDAVAGLVEAEATRVRLTPKPTGLQTTTVLTWASDLGHSQRLSVRVEAELDGPEPFIVAVRSVQGSQLLASAAVTPFSGTTVMDLEACITEGITLVCTGLAEASDLLLSITVSTTLSSVPQFVSPPVPAGHLLAFSHDAPGEATQLDFSATTSCGAVEYEVQDAGQSFELSDSEGLLRGVDDKGVQPGEEECLTVTATSTSPVCFLADRHLQAPCSATFELCYVTVTGFENVTNFSVLENIGDLVTFREPTEPIAPYLRLNSTGFRSPAALAVGTQSSHYFLAVDLNATAFPGVVIHDTLAPVTVTVNVFFGETTFVPQLGHEFFPDLNMSMDFLAESTSAHGVEGLLVPMDLDLGSSEGVALRFEANKRGSFFYNPPAGLTSRLLIHAVYCRPTVFTQDYQPEELTEPAETTIIAAGLNVETEDLGSGYKPNGDCFLMHATTGPIAGTHDIPEIVVVFTPQHNASTANQSSTREPYRVTFFSEFLMLTENVADNPGRLLLAEDNQPPQFDFCPTVVEAVLPPFSDTIQVNFTAPTATDNAGTPQISSTHSPGDFFNFFDSPYLIQYTAIDAVGLIAHCEFSLVVVHHANHEEVEVMIPAFFPLAAFNRETSFVQHSIYADTLIPPGLTHISVTYDPSQRVGLTVRVRPPPGERLWFAGTSPATADDLPGSVVVVCDLQFRNPAATGPLPTETPADLFAFTSIDPVDVRDRASGRALDMRPSFPHKGDASIVSMEPGNEYMRLLTESAAFEANELTLSHFEITLEYPFSVNSSSGPVQLNLLPGSFAVFAYLHTDPKGSPFPEPARSHHFDIFDPVPPNVTSCPGDIEVFLTANEAGIAVNWADPTFADDRGIVALERNFQSGDFFPLTETGAPHVVEVVAKDISRNAARCSFAISVLDRTPPVLDCPASRFEAPADANGTTIDTADINLTDNSGSASLQAFGAARGIGQHNLTLIAEDEEGNRADCHWVVNVVDVTPPVVACPALLVQHDLQAAFTPEGLVLASDNSGSFAISHVLADDPSVALGSVEFEVRRYSILSKAVDPSGNEGTCAWDLGIFDSRLGRARGAAGSGSTSDRELGVGLGLGICALVAIIAGLVARERRKQLPHDFNELMEELQRLDKLRYDADGPIAPRELKRTHITMLATLGKGYFGEVKKALMNEGNGIPDYLVAVKMHHGEFEGRKEMLQEALVMAQFKHQHIVAIVGVVTVGNPLLIALEYCEGGELKQYLVNNETDLKFKLTAARDCASGLAYLSGRGFVHRDIAARNCLISSDMRFKISDFGLSRDTAETTYYHSRGGAMPVRWTAPEALEHRKFTTKSDCWSFGVLVHELFTRAELPYIGWSNQKVWTQVCAGYRLPRARGCPEVVYDKMLACWTNDWRSRPDFSELESLFIQLLESDTVVIEAQVGEELALQTVATEDADGTKKARTYVDLIDATPPDNAAPVAGVQEALFSSTPQATASEVNPNTYDMAGGMAAATASTSSGPAAAAPLTGTARKTQSKKWLRERKMTMRKPSQASLGDSEWVNPSSTIATTLVADSGRGVAVQTLGHDALQDGCYDELPAAGLKLRGTLRKPECEVVGPPPTGGLGFGEVKLQQEALYDQELV